ncbi:6-aminohexanoate-dimer hydrolase [Paenibacillus albidus]|uniref:6-aminohexanoate-dimer hydrolase n=2 Tax=Paenibacillus albidus TaxID=2041023 RepID=A0A917FPR5_9BACL|nr:6-aminohexanoate-dimer hydrolase [Paenibacillus albidus]
MNQQLPLLSSPVARGSKLTQARPEDTGTQAPPLENLHFNILKEFPRMHSLLIIRHGKLIFERYYGSHQAGMLNDLRSATKSVLSILTGIAIGRGDLPGIHTSVAELLHAYIPPRHSPELAKITLGHLLTMTSGFSWITGKRLGEPLVKQLHRSRQWGLFALGLPIIPENIGHFQYRSTDSHLISMMLSESTGLDAYSYARLHLFEPLGITHTAWVPSPEGHSMGHIGLYLTSRDMAKIGVCLLEGGRFADKPVIPGEWLQQMLAPQTAGYPAFGDYGYQFWTGSMSGQTYRLAHGHGGQQILLLPELDAAVIFTAESKVRTWKNPRRLVEQYIIPAMC